MRTTERKMVYKHVKSRQDKRESLIGYVFVLPAVIYMLVFIGYPIVYNWFISVQDVTAMTLGDANRDFIGFDNFRSIMQNATLGRSVFQTFFYTIFSLIFQFTLGFLFAMFFSKNFRFAKPLRGFLVISWMMPITVTALVFRFMFAEGSGIINTVLLLIGVINEPIGWLIQGNTAMWALIITNTWIGVPFNMLLLTTGLNNISTEIYEAASIDGAGIIDKFFRITMPLMKPTIMSVLVLGFVFTFKVFDLVFVMTGGGPVDATEVLSTFSYRLSFTLFRFGEGAAVANVLFICLFFIALLYLFTITKEETI
jgi:multiple sugar transport system permease protein